MSFQYADERKLVEIALVSFDCVAESQFAYNSVLSLCFIAYGSVFFLCLCGKRVRFDM